MAGPTWGAAEVEVTADGRLLPTQVRAIAAKAGKEAGASFAKEFGNAIDKHFPDILKSSSDNIKKVGDEAKKTEPKVSRLGAAFDKLTNRMRAHNRIVGGNTSAWKSLSANTRQWTLIIGAVIASLSDLAALSSAAGSGLLVLGGAFSGLVVGAGTAFAAFKVFTGDIEKLPAVLKPARAEMDKFVSAFDKLGDAIAIAAFKDTSAAWASLRQSVQKLTPAFESVGKIVGSLFKDFAKSIKDNEKGLDTFIRRSGKIFDQLIRAVGRVADALLDAFNNPNFQRSISEFLGWIDDLADSFSEFLRGPGFDEWLNHGRDIFGAFGRLLETTGRLLNNLVTDDSVKKLVDFIDNLSGFLEGPGEDLLKFFEELDIFGLIAEALNKFGTALAPLGKPMRELAKALNDVIQSGIDTLAPIFEEVATALAPLVQGIANFMKANPEAMGRALGFIAVGLGAIAAVKFTTNMVTTLGSFFGVIGKGTSGKNVKGVNNFARALGGLSLAVAGLVDAADQSKTKGIMDLLGDSLASAGGGAAIGSVFGPIGAAIGALIGQLAFLGTVLTTNFDDIIASGADVLDFFGVWPEKAQAIRDAFKDGLIPSNVLDALPILGQGIATWWDGIVATFNAQLAIVNATVTTWLLKISTEWNNFLNDIKTNITNWWNGIVTGWNNFWTNLSTTVTVTWIIISTTIRTWWNNITTTFTNSINSIKNAWNAFWATLNIVVQTRINIVTNVVRAWINGLKLIVSVGLAGLGASWNSFWNRFAAPVQNAVGAVQSAINRIISSVRNAINAIAGLNSSARSSGGGPRAAFASGGVLTGPRRILAGEAGPEAIVPLRRNLNQVDPSVRWLSAIAQNKTPAMAGGGVVGGGRTNVIEAGAIVVQEAHSALATGVEVLNRITNNLD